MSSVGLELVIKSSMPYWLSQPAAYIHLNGNNEGMGCSFIFTTVLIRCDLIPVAVKLSSTSLISFFPFNKFFSHLAIKINRTTSFLRLICYDHLPYGTAIILDLQVWSLVFTGWTSTYSDSLITQMELWHALTPFNDESAEKEKNVAQRERNGTLMKTSWILKKITLTTYLSNSMK